MPPWNPTTWFLRTLLLTLASLDLLVSTAAALQTAATTPGKQVIGPTALVEEIETDLTFAARVDTGATTSSLHVEDWKIKNEAKPMSQNIGKTIRFRIKNERGESEWIQRKIADISLIKTSEQQEQRYKVRMTLKCQDVKKKVLVSLNDRSHMAYPVLLGRNFLQGDFLVDVELGEPEKAKNENKKTEQLPQPESDDSKPTPAKK